MKGIDITKFLPLLNKICSLQESKERIIIAIDGNSAAGKTTLAAALKARYNCNVFHMDDFFLQPFQRTPERLDEPGGNVDYERFTEELLKPLQTGNPFSYKPYNVPTQTWREPVYITPNTINIIEGSYSLNPYFGDVHDIKVFLRIDEEEQLRRQLVRNPEKYDMFVNRWIPLENKYFKAFNIADKCDFVFNN